MIPIRDTIQSKNYPVVNTVIIATNALFFLVQAAQGEGLNRFIFTYGLVPARYSIPEIASYFTFSQQVIALFSFMSLNPFFISAMKSVSDLMAKVSRQLSYSSGLTSTAAGRPFLVITSSSSVVLIVSIRALSFIFASETDNVFILDLNTG